MMLAKRMVQRLIHQKDQGLYRNPTPIFARKGRMIRIKKRNVINFASNDYLGLGNSDRLGRIVARNFEKYGPSGSSSRLVSGYYNAVKEAEAALAEYFGYESALIYPSGYQCNLGVIATLFEKGDRVFGDKHIHASGVTAVKLSGARFYGFRHNNTAHLEKRLNHLKASPTAILTESLFSMDGDLLDVTGLARIKKIHKPMVIVDEAHAFGVMGKKGRGIARPSADIAVGTFGKALGFFGAFVLLPYNVREYLINFSSPLIYTTALPEAHGATIPSILKLVAAADRKRDMLKEISQTLKNQLRAAGFTVGGDAHIITVAIGSERAAGVLCGRLFEMGLFVFSARFPTVPLNKSILRISMTAEHTLNDVKTLACGLIKAVNDVGS
jgi:8-amino-7-oxononanoate synthase